MIAELVFGANVSRQDVDIEILYDTVKEMREVFTVHLKHRSGTAVVKVSIVFPLHFSNNLFSTLHISLVRLVGTVKTSWTSCLVLCIYRQRFGCYCADVIALFF